MSTVQQFVILYLSVLLLLYGGFESLGSKKCRKFFCDHFKFGSISALVLSYSSSLTPSPLTLRTIRGLRVVFFARNILNILHFQHPIDH